MIKKKILKDDGRYLIFYSFPGKPEPGAGEHRAAPACREGGVTDNVGDAMEPCAQAMGCDSNTPPGKDI